MTRYMFAMELLKDKDYLDEPVNVKDENGKNASSDAMALESAVDCNFEYNYIFTLGYDLLQNFLSEKSCECDAAFEFCKIIYIHFKQSEYSNPNKSEYDCLKEYVNSLTYDQLDELYWTDWSTL